MKKRSFWLKIIIGIALIYFTIFHPIPYYIEGPGEAFELEEMIKVDGKQDDTAGSFLMTTVGIAQATPLTSFMQFLPNYTGVSEEEILGGTQNTEEYLALQEFYMDSSVHTSLAVAFEAADEEVNFETHGVYVMQVTPESDFSDSLQIGDVIHTVDGRRFEHSQQFVDYVSSLEAGETVTIEFERDGESISESGDLIEIPTTGTAGIGIGLVDNTTIETEPHVEINSGDIGGPSAGLMYSLQIYSQLEEINLLEGNKIAGTGTISPDGTVGRIGGVDKKVVTAANENADYFLAPDDEIDPVLLEENPNLQTNYEQAAEKAERIDADIEVIPINNFQDAVEFLEQL